MFKLSLSATVAFSLLATPFAAFAHETQVFTIGDKQYSIVAGSLNEPLVVDDKSGVELMVSQLGVPAADTVAHDDGDDHGEGVPVAGLENTLKVEISAADKKKVLDLSPLYGELGSYKAVFIPTVQTTLSYRFFGTINATPVDFTFTCNPAGHPQTPEDTASVKVSDTVTRTLKKGAFGCPLAKADMGFPEPSTTLYDLSHSPETTEAGFDAGMAGLIAGVLGFLMGGIALLRKKPTPGL